MGEAGIGTSQQRTIGLTGASGFVGRYVVREALARGWSVRGLVRDRAKAARVLPADLGERLTLITGDVLDASALDDVLKHADAVVNTVGIIREARGGQTFRRMHVEATRSLLDALRRAGLRRFVQVSALGVKDEGVSPYQRSKFEAETLVRSSGLDWTILRPSLIHGPENEFLRMVARMARGEQHVPFLPYFRAAWTDHSVPLGPTRYREPEVAPVHVQDVARCVAEAISRPASIGEVYQLCGPDVMSWPELLAMVRDNVPGASHSKRIVGLPADIMAIAARGAALIGMGEALPFDAGMALMAAEDSAVSTAKAQRDLGVPFQSTRDTLPGYAPRLVGAA